MKLSFGLNPEIIHLLSGHIIAKMGVVIEDFELLQVKSMLDVVNAVEDEMNIVFVIKHDEFFMRFNQIRMAHAVIYRHMGDQAIQSIPANIEMLFQCCAINCTV